MDTIHNAVASLIARDNVRVLYNTDHKLGLKQMIKVLEKIEEETVLNFPSSRDPDCLIARLLNLDLTTWKEFKKIHGTSLKHICTLSKKDLQKIPKIGPAKSKNIIELLENGW
jgi:DNA uptake protein ComE-like DNA-binding protein